MIWYALYRRLGMPQGRSRQLRKISPLPGLDPRTVQPVANRYTYYAIWPMKIDANSTLTQDFWRWRQYVTSKRREPITEWRNVIREERNFHIHRCANLKIRTYVDLVSIWSTMVSLYMHSTYADINSAFFPRIVLICLYGSQKETAIFPNQH